MGKGATYLRRQPNCTYQCSLVAPRSLSMRNHRHSLLDDLPNSIPSIKHKRDVQPTGEVTRLQMFKIFQIHFRYLEGSCTPHKAT